MKPDRCSFYIAREKTFTVEVVCFAFSEDEWAWNVYAHIFEGHPLFSDDEKLKNGLPLHCGCSFDEHVTRSPIGGIRWDWQRKRETKTVGSDYRHLWSPDLSIYGPLDGVPSCVQRDADELKDYLLMAAEAENSEFIEVTP